MNKTWNLKEMKKLIPLALPVLVVNLSIVGMGAVDAIVAGRAGGKRSRYWPESRSFGSLASARSFARSRLAMSAAPERRA